MRKPSRWARAWLVWLALPPPLRLGAVIVVVTVAGLLV